MPCMSCLSSRFQACRMRSSHRKIPQRHCKHTRPPSPSSPSYTPNSRPSLRQHHRANPIPPPSQDTANSGAGLSVFSAVPSSSAREYQTSTRQELTTNKEYGCGSNTTLNAARTGLQHSDPIIGRRSYSCTSVHWYSGREVYRMEGRRSLGFPQRVRSLSIVVPF